MMLMTNDDLYYQDPEQSPYGLPNQISPLRGAFTQFGLTALQDIQAVKSLVNSGTQFAHKAVDGWYNESPQVSNTLPAELVNHLKTKYPGLEISNEASQEQVEAAIYRYQLEGSIHYLNRHISPGFAGQAALFAGQMAPALVPGTNLMYLPALKGAAWASRAVGMGSELLAGHVAQSAVSRVGGTASVKAQQLITDHAGKIAFAKSGAAVGAFTGIHEGIQETAAHLSGVLTPNEADYRIMDTMFNMASSGMTFGLLGGVGEKLTGRLVNKTGVGERMEARAAARDEIMGKVRMMSMESGSMADVYRKSADVVKSFFQSNKDTAERQTMDNVAAALENGKEPESEFLHQVNRHEAWERLHTYLNEAQLSPDDFIKALGDQRQELLNTLEHSMGHVELYHSTPAANVGTILESGLTSTEYAQDFATLTDTHHAAVEYGMRKAGERDEPQPVLRVRIPFDRINEFLHDEHKGDIWRPRSAEGARLYGIKKPIPKEFVSRIGEKDAFDDVTSAQAQLDALAELAANEALIDLAKATEDDVSPLDEIKARWLNSMRDNSVKLDDVEAPYIKLDDIEPDAPDMLQRRIEAFSDEELESLAQEPANTYARRAIRRKALLRYEQPLTEFIERYGTQIAQDIEEGAIFDEAYLREAFERITPDDVAAVEDLFDANKTDIAFMLDHIRAVFEDLQKPSTDANIDFTPEQLHDAIARQFRYIKGQVIRAQRDAVSFSNKLAVLDEAVKSLSTSDGRAIKEGLNALLDRSQFQFKGANQGTYRKMNDATLKTQAQFTLELERAKVMEAWNDTNSSTEISQALFNQEMGLSMDEISQPVRKIAEIVKRFYDKAIDSLAKEGIFIERLQGRIHHQWHNPYRILRMPLKQRLSMGRAERREFQFSKWFDFVQPKIDMVKTFVEQTGLEGEPLIDINDPIQVRQAFRRIFDKVIELDYRKEKTNLINKRNKQRFLQFKDATSFAEYNREFGAGDAQTAILRELNGMFREVELVKDWGAEPEAMLEDILKHGENLPGWNEYKLRSKNDQDTPRRLMHLMRYGSAHATGEWGMMFSELVYNVKAYESVTKLGNLLFLNQTDSLVAANALNRLGIPMMESITKGIQETYSRYTHQQKMDVLRMFNVSKENYMGGFYRHAEDGTLSSRLNKAIRIVMKITGTENSEYSNKSMIGQSISNWFATNLKRSGFDAIDKTSRGTLSRYDIGRNEWDLFKKAIRKYKGNDYIGWDTIHELSDKDIRAYLRKQGVKDITGDRVEITRDDLAQRYRLLMQDQMDDAVNRKSLIETDLLRFKRPADKASAIDDALRMMMLFKTYGFMWIRRHVGDRIYGRGAQGYRISQIQGTADWQGLMKLMTYSFAMEFAVAQMISITNDKKPLPLNGATAMDALMASLGPIAYVTRVDGANFLSSLTRIAAGPIGTDVERVARIITQFERGFWKGDYSTAQTNLIKFISSQFGGVPGLKSALNTLFFDNLIQQTKGRRLGHIIDNVATTGEG